MGHHPSRPALPSPLAHPRHLLWCLMVSYQPWAAPLRHVRPDTQTAAPFEASWVLPALLHLKAASP